MQNVVNFVITLPNDVGLLYVTLITRVRLIMRCLDVFVYAGKYVEKHGVKVRR